MKMIHRTSFATAGARTILSAPDTRHAATADKIVRAPSRGRRRAALWLGVCLAALTSILSAQAQATRFNYQGWLTDAGSAASGNYDLQFVLFDAATNGNAVGPVNTLAPVAVSNGLFSITLDFGSAAFEGSARWVQIAVRTNGSASAYATLAPRQPVLPTPYAIHAGNSALLGGRGSTDFAPASGSSAYVAKAGDTMTGTLNLPANGLVGGGSQFVLAGGNVGIGTANPDLALTVQTPGIADLIAWRNGFGELGRLGSAFDPRSGWLGLESGGAYQVQIAAGGPTYFNGGNVGIGTTSPQAKLDVAGTVQATALQGDGSGLTGVAPSGTAGGDLAGTYPNPTIANNTVTSAKLASDAAALNKVSGGAMTSSGDNIGIGTVSPQAKLDVNGTARMTGFQLTASPSAGKILTSDASGNGTWQSAPVAIPRGVIVMWSGTLATIPSGWALCDGANATPDLRDRFIMGVPPGQNPGATGGSAAHYHTVNAHTHGVSIPQSTTIAAGTHDHSYYTGVDWNEGTAASGSTASFVTSIYGFFDYTSSAGNHSHTVPSQSLTSGAAAPPTSSESSLPPHYKLAFIMKL